MRRACVILAVLALVCLSACSKMEDDPKTGIQVQFSAAPVSGPAPLTVQFTDESVGPGLNVWHWNFGDGSTSTERNPNHVYVNTGSYNVTLSVSNALGSETLTKPEYVIVPDDSGGIIDPMAFRFEPSEVTVSPGETVNFTLVNGISPYQVGYVDTVDIQSYDDPSQMQGQIDPNTGSGYYVVGLNDDCTDRLAAVDSDGELCYLRITVGTGGEPLPGPGPDPGPLPGSPNADETEVFNLVNDERQKVGRAALQWCEGLYNCAKAHSCDMCDRGFFSHVNPESEGPTDRARAGHAGSYTFTPIVSNPYAWIGENIAHGYTSAVAVMNGWMNSTGHRANILDPDYTHIGIGRCEGCRTHWTQTFGTR